MKRLIWKILAAIVMLPFAFEGSFGYPIDGYKTTGIRRLERLNLVMQDSLWGTKPPPGGQWSISQIKLNLQNARGDSLATLPAVDTELQKQIEALFPNRHESYSLAVLEITPGKKVRFAQRQADRNFSPGSVGKLAIASGLFTELKRLYPDSPEKRAELMRNHLITADRWVIPNHHQVPVYNREDRKFVSRAIKEGDVFTLYEWADHMLSASSNAAASVVWKEVMLMRKFGKNYPPTPEQEKAFFDKTPKDSLRMMAVSLINDPLRVVGISENEFKLGSFFTRTGKNIVPGERSTANPLGLLKYLVALERGKMVDGWSSLEIKRLMYMTAKRIRYASSPRLADAAVYYKSGSLYRCKEEPGFTCGKYMGNVENVLNSVAIVEHPSGAIYLTALMSNVLKKNSAVEHQTIATYVDRIIRKDEEKATAEQKTAADSLKTPPTSPESAADTSEE